jgi:predicted nucleic acid-binding protein
MITAVDTSVLLDVLRPNANFVDRSLASLETSATLGPVVLCDPVYAELAANFERMHELDAFLADARIRRESPNANALFLSGRTWRAYRSAGGSRERIISDFVVGAHARVQAGRLVTRDRGFYRRYFEDLVVVEP